MIYSKSHSGSVASFIVVAVVLVGAVVGAVWYLQNQDSAPTDEPATEVAQNDTDKSKGADDKADSEATKEEEQAAESEAKKKIESESESAENTDESDKSDDATSENAGEDTAPESAPVQNQEDFTASSEDLPETGPTSSTLSSVLGLMAIVGSGYVYYHFGRK